MPVTLLPPLTLRGSNARGREISAPRAGGAGSSFADFLLLGAGAFSSFAEESAGGGAALLFSAS